MNKYREAGRQFGSAAIGVREIRYNSEPNLIALIKIDAALFEEYTVSEQLQRERGFVWSFGNDNKYMANHDFTTNIANPAEDNRFLLVRSISEFDKDGTPRQWVREEPCITGTIRHHDGLRYKVRPHNDPARVRFVQSATPPPNATQDWERLPD